MRKLNRARTLASSACLALLLLAAACGGEQLRQAVKTFDDKPASGVPVKSGVKPEADAEAAVIETDYGRVVVELYPNLAPQMVERFKTLAGRKFYDGTTFHRINPAAGIIQGGDPNSRDAIPENDGAGNSDLPNLPAELSDIPYDRGIVGAARLGEREGVLTARQAYDTANCQFFITLKRQPDFDGEYTIFGRVIEGINNADIISTAPVAAGTADRSAERITIKSITLAPRSHFK